MSTTFIGRVNPFLVHGIEFPFLKNDANAQDFLNFISNGFEDISFDEVKKRTTSIASIVVVSLCPAQKIFLNTMVQPLKTAKGLWILRNYVECIAVCGMVCEMIAIATFMGIHAQARALEKQLIPSVPTEDDFEKEGQSKRISILKEYNLIDDEEVSAFKGVATIRNKYLHFITQSHDAIANDAKTVLKYTFELFRSTFCRWSTNPADAGTVHFKPGILELIRELEKAEAE